MRSRTSALIALAAVFAVTAALAADTSKLDALFDGKPAAAPARLEEPAAPAAPPSAEPEDAEYAGAETAAPAAVPQDLKDAKARVGIDANLAKLSAAPQKDRFTFGVIGDAERGRFAWERVFSPGKRVFEDELTALQSSGVDFVLQLGDFVSKGTVENYRAHVALIEKIAKTPLLRCIGNHDRSRPNGDADRSLYDAVMGPRDYYFDRGDWRFIALDSSDRVVTPAQLAWLGKALEGPRRKVIFTHVPPAYLRKLKPLAAVGELRPEKPAAEGEKGRTPVEDFLTNYFDEGSKEFEALVAKGNVAAVYMGHIHAFWAADHQGVRYVISGGGGSPLYPLPPGYPTKLFAHTLTVAASPAGLTETVHPYKGGAFVLPPVKR